MKKNFWPFIIYVLGIIAIVAVSLLLDYWIATSNLPDWFKFALLQRGK